MCLNFLSVLAGSGTFIQKRSTSRARSKIRQRNDCFVALTFGFSSAMVNLLALLDTATQRTRARARARSRFINSNLTCALTTRRASTSPQREWLLEVTWGWTRSPDAGGGVPSSPLKAHCTSRERAMRYSSPIPPRHFSGRSFVVVPHIKLTSE